MKSISLTLFLLLIGSAATAQQSLDRAIARDYAYLDALFKHFHRNPELSFVEYDTAKRLAEELRKAGVPDVVDDFADTGVVGVLRNGKGPTVMIRADMDGLPVKERSGLSYASTATQESIEGIEKPVMHACGHDMHITGLVGTARRLVAMKDQWSGTVVFIGQPAEERIGGAKKMIEAGLYQKFPTPDYALALHVSSRNETGKIFVRPGLMYSSSDSVDIIVPGVGTHGASPHLGKDPVVIAAKIVLELQTIISREISPLKPGVITVGSIHGGTKHNIIGEEVKLELTVRSNDDETRNYLLGAIERVAHGVARTAGMPEDMLPTVKRIHDGTPTTVNDDPLTERLIKSWQAHFEPGVVQPHIQKGMGAEDFAYFHNTKEQVPSTYFIVGGTPAAALEAEKKGGPRVAGHHSPLFKISPEPSIKLGVEAMTVAALDLLAK